ncbi:right-handed parallel beta-helix repeat-containing protein [Methylobacterium nodulans]|uniref:right-handed parallel beta-helix repeat-containing protein n=1 Tax=Methylobacterium nodulans TaxID=114616 RepID=UPI0001618729|nr:right-handed parallel beta-helix repeat-containing protein [Methylobacterium nodulans]
MAETSVTLTRHDGTIVAHSGDVIKDLDIYVNSGAGIEVNGVQNVTISNVRIHYNGAGNKSDDLGNKPINMGIRAVNAAGLKIDQVEIINAGAPASGAELS